MRHGVLVSLRIFSNTIIALYTQMFHSSISIYSLVQAISFLIRRLFVHALRGKKEEMIMKFDVVIHTDTQKKKGYQR